MSEPIISKGFKTLQGRLTALVLVPVFILIFSGGVASLVFTRNMVQAQWNESARLKLQRAAHYIEMRLMEPVKKLETLLEISSQGGRQVTPEEMAGHLNRMEGVVNVAFHPPGTPTSLNGFEARKMMGHGMMQYRRTRISGISEPVFDTGLGHETLTLSLTLVDSLGWPSGEFRVKISFNTLLKDIFLLGWWQSEMACIVDQTGKYMAHTQMTMQNRSVLGETNDPLELAVLKQMERFPSGTLNSKGHPPNMVAGFYKLEKVPWTIIMFARGKNIFATIIRYQYIFGAGSLALIFIVLMLIRRHVCHIVAQIKALSDNAVQVSQGIYGPGVKPESQDEIGHLVVSYNEMVNGLKQRDFIRDSFGRYVDPGFAKTLLSHPDAGRLGGKRRKVVLMMSDIRGFTALAETLSPEVIIRILNQYFSIMIEIIQEHKGIIVDFFGDAILVFFDPLSEQVCDSAMDAVQCAAKMQGQMTAFNRLMRAEKLPELSMGIGINAGPVVVGNIGSKTRAKYGVVGSAVNITSRIQAKALKDEILISDSVYAFLKDEIEVDRTICPRLKGVEESVTLRSIRIFPGGKAIRDGEF